MLLPANWELNKDRVVCLSSGSIVSLPVPSPRQEMTLSVRLAESPTPSR